MFFSSWYRDCALQGLTDVSRLFVEIESLKGLISYSKQKVLFL